MLKIRRLPSIPDTMGMVARMMGTAPRRPGPGHQGLLLPGHPERQQADEDRQGPRDHRQHQAR